MAIPKYVRNQQACESSFSRRWRKTLLVIAVLIFKCTFILTYHNSVLAENKEGMNLPFPGTEVKKDKLLAEKMVYLTGPETIPEEHRFHTAIPKGWQKVKFEDLAVPKDSLSQVLLLLQDPRSGTGTKICVSTLSEEIAIDDWMDTFAIVNDIIPLAVQKNNGAMGPVDELLGRGSPNSSYPGMVFRLSAIRDSVYIYYILSTATEATYPELAQQLACISLYFKLDNPVGPKLAEPFIPYRMQEPVPVEILRPERWKIAKSVSTQHSSTAVFERKDKGIMVARLFLLTLSRKTSDKQNVNEYVPDVLSFLETEGFTVPPEISTIKVSSEKFLTGEYLSTSLLLDKNSHDLWLVMWESADAFYALGTISASRDYSPSLWMNARRIFALSSKSIKNVLDLQQEQGKSTEYSY